MHFKNSVKSTNLKVLLKAVKEVKSTMSTGKQFHSSTTRLTKNADTTFVLLLCLYSLYIWPLVWFNGACLKKSSNLTSTSPKTILYSTRWSQYVVVVARESLSLIAVIYFHTSMFLNQVSALCTDVELVQYIQYLAYLGETTLLNCTRARVKRTQ